jgi:hypothetical protein
MQASEFITDAEDFGPFPEHGSAAEFTDRAFTGSGKIEDVSAQLSLYRKEGWLTVVKNNSILIGGVHLSLKQILGKQYQHVDIIYILPEFRHTTAIKWLLYAIKEYADYPVIADGAIFKDGGKLISSMSKYGASQIKSLNKITGEKIPIAGPINDPDLCYIFESTRLGPGKNYFNEDANSRHQGWIWYAETLFDPV